MCTASNRGCSNTSVGVASRLLTSLLLHAFHVRYGKHDPRRDITEMLRPVIIPKRWELWAIAEPHHVRHGVRHERGDSYGWGGKSGVREDRPGSRRAEH